MKIKLIYINQSVSTQFLSYYLYHILFIVLENKKSMYIRIHVHTYIFSFLFSFHIYDVYVQYVYNTVKN